MGEDKKKKPPKSLAEKDIRKASKEKQATIAIWYLWVGQPREEWAREAKGRFPSQDTSSPSATTAAGSLTTRPGPTLLQRAIFELSDEIPPFGSSPATRAAGIVLPTLLSGPWTDMLSLALTRSRPEAALRTRTAVAGVPVCRRWDSVSTATVELAGWVVCWTWLRADRSVGIEM